MASPLARAGLPLFAATLLAAGCGQRADQPPQPPPQAEQSAASEPTQSDAAAHATRRPTPQPGLVLAQQIRAALSRTDWPASFDPDTRPAGAPEWQQERCLDIGPRNVARCVYGAPGATRSVALMGDSVAVGWLPGLRRAPSLRDARIHVLTKRQCANLRGFVSPSCTSHQDWAIDRLRQLRPELVVLSARYQGGQTWQQWQTGTARFLEEVRPYAKRVVVLTPPTDTMDARECYRRGMTPGECARPVSKEWLSYAYAESKASSGRARFVDARPLLCVAERCPALVGDLPVTFDGRHLTGAYAARLGPVFGVLLR